MNRNIRRTSAFLFLPLALALGACEDDDPVMMDDEMNIVQTAQDAGAFGTLLTALDVAGLTSALEGMGPFTVFAPTDDAFAAVDPEVLNDLLGDSELLTAVLTYHVVPGEFAAADVAGLSAAPTLNGRDVTLSFDGTTVMVDGATVISADVQASNGIIHVIDQVLLPEPIADIIQTAKGAGIFGTLLAAVDAAGLTETLKGDGPFTVFAPTDDAFAAIDPDALNALLADPVALAGVLTYHVVPGELAGADVLATTALTTVNGADAAISLDGEGNPRIDDALIIQTDVGARNGIVHVIDRVIFPE
ncbi:MAG: fasciclin domain-containing protein [Gemmatimonadetes bacterium]|nr:fasciclin domain-containing protein [Gemmatimonadota bacterium]NNM05768.1 fasciclin domain-containing protein [Gemmatimonadota bacterium]